MIDQLFGQEVQGLIINVIWILLALSSTVLAILIFRKELGLRRKSIFEQRSKVLERALLIHISGSLKELKQTFIVHSSDVDVLTKILPKILWLLKDTSKNSISDFINTLGLKSIIRSNVNSIRLKTSLSAIEILGYLPTERKHLEILHTLIRKNQNPIVVYRAAKSLSQLHSAESLPVIIKYFHKLEFCSTPYLANILSGFGTRAYPSLRTIINSVDSSINLKIASVRVLGSDGGLNIKNHELILSQCSNANEKMVIEAYRSLSTLNRIITSDIIKTGSMHPLWEVRLYTADCARHCQKIPIDELNELIADEKWLVGLHAARAIMSFGQTGKRILEVISRKTTLAATRASSVLNEFEAMSDG
jgi:hypothetical protein